MNVAVGVRRGPNAIFNMSAGNRHPSCAPRPPARPLLIAILTPPPSDSNRVVAATVRIKAGVRGPIPEQIHQSNLSV